MNRVPIQLAVCLIAAGLTLFALVNEQNHLTELQLMLPMLNKEVKALQEENRRLQYLLDCFENPVHLLELARKPEFGHLHYPTLHDVRVLPKGNRLEPVESL